jgi:hypothetical protein
MPSIAEVLELARRYQCVALASTLFSNSRPKADCVKQRALLEIYYGEDGKDQNAQFAQRRSWRMLRGKLRDPQNSETDCIKTNGKGNVASIKRSAGKFSEGAKCTRKPLLAVPEIFTVGYVFFGSTF